MFSLCVRFPVSFSFVFACISNGILFYAVSFWVVFFNGTSTPVRSHSRNSPSYCTQHVVTFCIRCVATHQYVEHCIRLFKFRKIGRKKYSDFHFHCDLFKGLNLPSLLFVFPFECAYQMKKKKWNNVNGFTR